MASGVRLASGFEHVMPSEAVILFVHSLAEGAQVSVALHMTPNEAERLADELCEIAATARDRLRENGWTPADDGGWQKRRG